MFKLNIFFIFFLFVISKNAIADEQPESTTFTCNILKHIQILRTIITKFDTFEFEVTVKENNVILTDRYFYGASNLEFLKKDNENNWLASDGINRLILEDKYLYISRLDSVGVKSMSAYCKKKKFE